jgi:hypothetical protein
LEKYAVNSQQPEDTFRQLFANKYKSGAELLSELKGN